MPSKKEERMFPPNAKNDEIDLKQIEDLPFITFTKNSGIRPMANALF